MKQSLLTIFAFCCVFLAVACLDSSDLADDLPDGDTDEDTDGDPDTNESDGDSTEAASDGDEEIPLMPLSPEAGYIEIEPINYSFHKGPTSKQLESSRARLWYIFQPADENPEEKPLFIFFNGGPGSATGLLFGFNTARMTLDPAYTGNKELAENEFSWTSMGNLIFVDARETGFSYNTVKNAEDESVRSEEFRGANFNCFFDGADFVRLLLRFLKTHPQIRTNPVVIAGESYGGIRSTVMLNLLLHYRSYADGTRIYQDPSLTAEIQAHYDAAFPDRAGGALLPEEINSQFGRQVLIQPLLSGVYQDRVAGQLFEQPGSPFYQMAEEEGVEYIPCSERQGECDPISNAWNFLFNEAKRDIYNYTLPSNWMNDLADAATTRLLKLDILSESTDFDVTGVSELYAENRKNAYRVIDKDAEWTRKKADTDARLLFDERLPMALRMMNRQRGIRPLIDPALTTGDLIQTFGELEKWDRYYISTHNIVNYIFYVSELIAFEVDPYQPVYGEMFLENLLDVKTFITNAAYDLIIYQPALEEALELHGDLVDKIDWETAPRDENEDRAGWLTVHYSDLSYAGRGANQVREVRFPYYEKSCHAVEITEPEEFVEDVRQWMSE